LKTTLKIASIISKKSIIPELKAGKKEDAVAELVKRLVSARRIKAGKERAIVKAVRDREKLGTTGLGRGIAIPHARLADVDKLIGALGRSPAGLDFKSLDGEPIHAVFLFVVPAEPTDIAYGLMSRMADLCRHDNFAPFIAQAKGVDEIHEVLVDSAAW
jgi:mannitol/fructose-specific phosphotransferase system IIA component (Ntr-type)